MVDLFTKKFHKHIHLSRPEGWGKTVALDMIRRFLGIEVDENGKLAWTVCCEVLCKMFWINYTFRFFFVLQIGRKKS